MAQSSLLQFVKLKECFNLQQDRHGTIILSFMCFSIYLSTITLLSVDINVERNTFY